MVPKGWKIGLLSDLADTVMGFAFKSTDFSEHGVPLLRMGNLYQNSLDFERNPVFLPESFKEEYRRFLVMPGDLVMSMTGTMGKRDYGFTVEIPTGAPDSLLNQRVMKFVPKNKTSPGYLLNLLRSELILSRLYSFPGGTKQANLSAAQVQSLPAPIPPSAEQKKIAQILSTWDKAITTTEQLLANSQQQKKALMQQLLTGKKRLLDENGVPFGGEWETETIGGLLKEVKRPVDWDDDAEYKLLSVKRRSEGVVLREIRQGSQILTKKMNTARAGDFLISKMQVVHGASGLVTEEFDGFHVSDSYISLVPKDRSRLDVHFFSWLSKQGLMYHKAFLCSYGVHIEKMTFNFKMYMKEKVSIPALLEEQEKIAAVLSAADHGITTLQRQLDALKQEKKALMQQLLTGKRRVKVEAAA